MMQPLLDLLLTNLGTVMVMMIMGWLISLIVKNVTIVDSLWGMGFVVIAWLTLYCSHSTAVRPWLIAALVTAWGMRLSLYLTWRNWGKGEDSRYEAWRNKSASTFWLQSLFKVFVLQALFLWVISLSMQFAQMSAVPERLTLWDIFGALLWLIGFCFEAAGDAQLAAFKADPKNRGKVMNRGLWAYTRHPNYFGEALIWWGIFIIGLSTPNSWWTVISPIVITAVLLKMTGIPLSEALLVERRPGYAEYIQKTSAFIPWLPKKGEQ